MALLEAELGVEDMAATAEREIQAAKEREHAGAGGSRHLDLTATGSDGDGAKAADGSADADGSGRQGIAMELARTMALLRSLKQEVDSAAAAVASVGESNLAELEEKIEARVAERSRAEMSECVCSS